MSMERVERIKKTAHHHYFDGTVEIKEKHFDQLCDTVKQQSEQIEGKDKQFDILNNLFSKEQNIKRKYINLCEEKDQRIDELEKTLREISLYHEEESHKIALEALNK